MDSREERLKKFVGAGGIYLSTGNLKKKTENEIKLKIITLKKISKTNRKLYV